MKIIAIIVIILSASCVKQDTNFFKEFEGRDNQIRALRHQNDSLRNYITEKERPFNFK